jgi:hypothetical protein
MNEACKQPKAEAGVEAHIVYPEAVRFSQGPDGGILESCSDISVPLGKHLLQSISSQEQGIGASYGSASLQGQSRKTSTGSTVLDTSQQGGTLLDSHEPKSRKETGPFVCDWQME